MIRQKHILKLLLSLGTLLSSCAVQNLSQPQTVYNFSQNAFAASAGTNTGATYYSGKVHMAFGLVSWGDASIYSAKNIAGNHTYILNRISVIDEQRKFLLGFGYYRIIIKGKVL